MPAERNNTRISSSRAAITHSKGVTTIVKPSRTGLGTHTRWVYHLNSTEDNSIALTSVSETEKGVHTRWIYYPDASYYQVNELERDTVSRSASPSLQLFSDADSTSSTRASSLAPTDWEDYCATNNYVVPARNSFPAQPKKASTSAKIILFKKSMLKARHQPSRMDTLHRLRASLLRSVVPWTFKAKSAQVALPMISL